MATTTACPLGATAAAAAPSGQRGGPHEHLLGQHDLRTGAADGGPRHGCPPDGQHYRGAHHEPGRKGTFMLRHSPLAAGGDGDMRVDVVPGAGTGELGGLPRELRIAHDAPTSSSTRCPHGQMWVTRSGTPT